jgi:NADH-quinone oxidoreductase subunit L
MFHLTTHAFFKALLFLGAGSVIHALSGEQDMRKMGGIWRKIPYTYALMWIGSLALAGIGIPGLFGFAGFYSKDVILEAAYGAHSGLGMFAFWLGVIAAFMTAFYSWRLLFLTFHGTYRGPDHHVLDHAHESPPSMMIPLVVLGIGATFSGIVAFDWFVGHDLEAFWRESIKILPTHAALHHAHESPLWVGLAPLVVGLAGIGLAYLFYIAQPDLPARVANAFRPVYLFFYNKWYFDELYDAIFVRPAFALARGFWKKGDVGIIDGLGPDGLAEASRGVARGASRLQSGYIYHYAFVMLIGVVALVSLYLLTRGR